MKRIIIIFVVIFASFLFVQQAQAYSITPASFVLDDLLPESKVKRTTHISFEGASPEAKYVQVSVTGTGFSAIELSAETVEIPNDKKTISYDFWVNPAELKEGSYESLIEFKIEDPNAVVSGSQTVPGLLARVLFGVTDEINKSFRIKSIGFIYVHNDNDIPRLKYSVKNTGNVPLEISHVEAIVSDNSGPVETIKFNENILIPEQSTEGVVSDFPFTLDRGKEYSVELKFFSDGNLINSKSGVRLRVPVLLKKKSVGNFLLNPALGKLAIVFLSGVCVLSMIYLVLSFKSTKSKNSKRKVTKKKKRKKK